MRGEEGSKKKKVEGVGAIAGTGVLIMLKVIVIAIVSSLAALGIAYAAGLNVGALWGDASANATASVEAESARREVAQRTAAGEEAPVLVSGCMQKPDGWTQPHFTKIPGAIFVSIASYRDDECKDTVTDLFNKASRPDDLFVGVCQQNKEKEEDCFDSCEVCAARKREGHIRVINFDYMDARGPTFARYQCSKLWRGEEWFLQVDSHTQFEEGWDEILREQLAATGAPSRAVLGAYPPTTEQMQAIRDSGYRQMITMCPGDFDNAGMPSIRAEVVDTGGRKAPVPTALQPAGCMCFPGAALYDVPFDPYLSFLFFGEEVLFSARLWTAGYDLFAPTRPFCVHHYYREDKPKYWADHAESEPCRVKAVQRAKFLLGMTDPASVHPDYFLEAASYGMGKARSLRAYQDFAGMDFRLKTVSKGCPKP
jgi:hypothetical protein